MRLPNGLDVFAINAGETRYLYREIFEQRCYLAHGVTMPERGVVVDVGAHIGLASLFFHTERPGVPIWAVEPAPKPRECLERNVGRHRINATVIPLAMGARRGRATFTYYPDNTTISGLRGDPDADTANVSRYLENAGLAPEDISALVPARYDHDDVDVEVVPLSDVLASLSEASIGLLKVDVEHSEIDVLSSLAEADWQRIEQVVVEVHDLDDAERLTRMLVEHSFHVEAEEDALLKDTGLCMLFATKSVC